MDLRSSTPHTAATFAQWVAEVSQRTNSSLAGSNVYVPASFLDGAAGKLLARQLEAWGGVQVASAEAADFIYPELPDAAPTTGEALWARAAAHMKVSSALAHELASSGALEGLRIACSLIVEPKTCVLLERLAAACATVGVYCHAHECDQLLADELARRGYIVEASASWTPAEEHAGALRLLDRLHPQIIIDDGANLARLLVMERPELLAEFIGVAEETTSGVRAFQAMEAADELPFPVIAVNDSALKTHFDNRHGTGESCVTTAQRILGTSYFEGTSVAVVGFGPVGEGFARRIRALGASVTIIEQDPVRALEAAFAGFSVGKAAEVLPRARMVVSATGVRHTLGLAELQLLASDTVVTVIGGIANEVALDVCAAAGSVPKADEVEPALATLAVPGGAQVRLLAAGDGINYAAGPGNPIEIMDLSFSVQLAAVAHLARHSSTLPAEVIRLGADVDRRIAELALAERSITLDAYRSTAELVNDWRLTHYADTAASVEEDS